jgi:hypothetical protein
MHAHIDPKRLFEIAQMITAAAIIQQHEGFHIEHCPECAQRYVQFLRMAVERRAAKDADSIRKNRESVGK